MSMPYCNSNKTEVPAHIPEQVKSLLRNSLSGEIIMVNSSAVYIRFDEEIVILCDAEWGMLPNGILLDDHEKDIADLKAEEGQHVLFKDDELIFPNGAIHLITGGAVSEAESCEDPKKIYIRQAANELAALKKINGISMLVEPLVLGKNNSAVIHLNPYCKKAYPVLERLTEVLMNNEEAGVRACLIKLLGLGTGLTPSADDVMLGMLYVFRKLRHKTPTSVDAFRDGIFELSDRCTNRISSTYLKAIIRGSYFERMERVWNGLCGTERLDISKLAQIGSSSGTEMLLGMLTALRICGYEAV